MAVGCCCSLAPMASGGTCGCGCWFSIMEDMTWGRGLGASQAFMGGVLVPPVTLSDGGMCLKFRQYLKFLKIILLLGELVICSNILGDKFYFFPYQSWTKWMNLANQNLYLLKWCRQILGKTTMSTPQLGFYSLKSRKCTPPPLPEHTHLWASVVLRE